MLYRTFPRDGQRVSALGIGCMRLAQKDGAVDRPAAISLIRQAIDGGVNYVDTAYGYHGGESERIVGEALQDGYRERVLLATKLPVWLVEKPEDIVVTSEEQENGTTVYHLHVAEDDMGRVIGKQGRIAKAIRVVMRAAATRNDKKIMVEID